MNNDEMIQDVTKQAVEIIREAAPDSPYIFILVAGKGRSYIARDYNGTALQIDTAVRNTVVNAALTGADAINQLLKNIAKEKPAAMEEVSEPKALAIDLLDDAMERIQERMEEKP